MGHPSSIRDQPIRAKHDPDANGDEDDAAASKPNRLPLRIRFIA